MAVTFELCLDVNNMAAAGHFQSLVVQQVCGYAQAGLLLLGKAARAALLVASWVALVL